MTGAVRSILRATALLICINLLSTQIAQAMPVIVKPQAETAAQTTAAAPVPAMVRKAKKVFVESHAGSSDMYNRFVTALNTWGYYTIVDTPEEADVILDFRDSPLEVTVLQPSSGVILWTVNDPLNGAYPQSRKKRESLEIENIVSSLKGMAGVPLTSEDMAALKPVTFRHNGGFVVLVSVLGGLAVAAVLVLVLHGRAKEK
jgi:hypothetical protein